MNKITQKRILIVDDSLADLRILTEILTRRGWSVSIAHNGKDGINKARMASFDLILLDVRMHGLDGYGVCRLLKADERCRNIPIVFLSALGEQDDRLEGLSLGAVDYIVKGYANTDEIVTRISIHLHHPHYQAPIQRKDTLHPKPFAVLLEAAETLILSHIGEDLSIPSVAQKLGVSERKLRDAFLLAYGKSAYAWLREEKLLIAQRMLANTDTSVGDMAVSLGYSSSQNFATAFRQRFGCTPKEFRNGVIKQTFCWRETDSSA